MALPPSFLDELRVRTPIATVIGRKVRLARSGRNLKGNCPFHGEKTPSFYVYDDHFHCFGCGAHGDAIGFVMQSQGLGFMEAVEALASEAGLDVPKPSPEAAENERRRLDLSDVLARASEFFQARLHLPEGRAALDYLRGRGLTDETIAHFGLGWSGDGRGALSTELGRDGITADQLFEAGLLRENEAGERRDLFYNRVMFPIRDRRGRVISFGGRILGDGQPKYVNGPETALFSKRRNLYALDLARAAARDGAVVTVVEGYTDVIALHQAGFTGAVAPLGTALTEEQLAEIWRITPAPVLCFDGDAAGARAAARAAELVLPMLTPANTLRLTTLPAGEDPDSLVRRQGQAGFQAVLDAARPLSDALFDLLHPGPGAETPERRAAFRARLEDAAKRIPDRALASEYRAALLDRFFASRRRSSPIGIRQTADRSGAGIRTSPPPARLAGPRIPPSDTRAKAERARILVAILLRHPNFLRDVDHAVEGLDLVGPLAQLRDALLIWAGHTETLDSDSLMSHLHQSGLQTEVDDVLSDAAGTLPACTLAGAEPFEVATGWWHFFGLLHPERLDDDVDAALQDFKRSGDAATHNRLVGLCDARNRLKRGEFGEVESI